MRAHRLPSLLACSSLLSAAAPPVAFVPHDDRFATGAAEYRQIWEREGERIAAALEEATGLTFPQLPIEVRVGASAPMTAYDGRTMRLRASYSPLYKKATLVHEMGHRISFLLPRTTELDDHRLLYLFLYDVWADLYGQPFADRMVSIERQIGPSYDASWTWALAMSRAERQERLRNLRSARTPRPAAP